MNIITHADFDLFFQSQGSAKEDKAVYETVKAIIESVKSGGDSALRYFSEQFDKAVPQEWLIKGELVEQAWHTLLKTDSSLCSAIDVAIDHIARFAKLQKKQFTDFEYEMAEGLWTGQRVVAVEKAAVYVPAGRFPLISSVLMGVIPALCAGVSQVFVFSPPMKNGMPDPHIMAASYRAGAHKVFAVGGAQAVAAAAFGTESIPRVDVIAGPGNKYLACAKQLLFGKTGVDLVAGPTDLLIIADEQSSVEIVAADMIAQAEHDPDSRARALVETFEYAKELDRQIKKQVKEFPASQASIDDSGSLIILYDQMEEACKIADTIAPEHLELHVKDAQKWVPALKNYGSLFIGEGAACALGDYSAGINHTLPTSGAARFTSGLSVRHFLKTLTTLRCVPGLGFDEACNAAMIIAQKEGLSAHAASARLRLRP